VCGPCVRLGARSMTARPAKARYDRHHHPHIRHILTPSPSSLSLSQCGMNAGFCKSLPAQFLIDSVRVYQKKSDPRQTVGCNPKERPTRKWIAGHAYRYLLCFCLNFRRFLWGLPSTRTPPCTRLVDTFAPYCIAQINQPIIPK
jgi:hypothetical protein